jgi:hypothetical protein
MEGWPSHSIFDHNYQIVTLSPLEFEVLQVCDRANSDASLLPEGAPLTVAKLLRQTSANLNDIRRMQQNQLILLQPLPLAS